MLQCWCRFGRMLRTETSSLYPLLSRKSAKKESAICFPGISPSVLKKQISGSETNCLSMPLWIRFHNWLMKYGLPQFRLTQIKSEPLYIWNMHFSFYHITVQNKFKFCVLDSHNPINHSGVRLGNCMKKYEKSLFFTWHLTEGDFAALL